MTAHPRIWSSLAATALPSWFLAGDGAAPVDPSRAPERWMEVVRRIAPTATSGAGAGWDMELRGEQLVGAGLWADGSVAHLAVFGA